MKKQQKENRYAPAYYKNAQNANSSATSNLSTKKIWTVVVLCLALIAAVTASLCVALYKEVIPENITSDSITQGTSDLTIKNADFKYTYADGENLQYPLVANNWTVKSTSSPNSVSMGVLDTADWDKVVADLNANNIITSLEQANPLYPNYDSSKGFDTEESRIYMIKKDALVESNATTLVSSSFSISAGNYMKISVWVKMTNVVGNGAFVALKNSSSGTASSNYYCVYHFNSSTATVTSNGWARYDFYVEGNKTTSKTMYLELGLGRKITTNSVTESAYGLIYFGGIQSESISRGEYNAHEQETLDTSKNYISYSFYTDESNVVLSDWSNDKNKELDSPYDTISYFDYEQNVGEGNMPFYYDKDTNEGNDLYMYTVSNNNTVKFAQFAVNPPSIDKCYRLSLWVRTNIIPTMGVYIYLNAYNKDGEYQKEFTTHFAKVQTPTDVENDTYNGWVEYQFYIQPHETDVYYFELEVSIGIRNTSVSGNNVAYLAEIDLHELDQHDYNSASASDTVVTVSLKSTITPSELLLNGSFNNSSTSAEGTSYPIAPSNWEMIFAGSSNLVENYDEAKLAPNRSSAFWPKTNEENPEEVYSSIGGIIYKTLNPDYYNSFGILNTYFNGYADDDAHSVLMIYNNQYTACGYKSSAINLSANSYYRISVLAKGTSSASPFVYLTNGGTQVICGSDKSASNVYIGTAFTEIDKTLTNGWVRYYVYIATGDTDKTVYLELWNGKRDSVPASGDYQQGAVMFDQAECVLLSDTTDGLSEEYENLFKANEETGENAYASMQNPNADIAMIYNEEQLVLSSANNLFVIDYRYNDVTVENDFDRIYQYSTKVREAERNGNANEFETMWNTLEQMTKDFNTKHYAEETEGTYYIDWESNSKSISELRKHLNSIKNPETTTDDTEEETTEPVDWLLITSLVVTVVMLAAIVGIIIRKFAMTHRQTKIEFENNYVG